MTWQLWRGCPSENFPFGAERHKQAPKLELGQKAQIIQGFTNVILPCMYVFLCICLSIICVSVSTEKDWEPLLCLINLFWRVFIRVCRFFLRRYTPWTSIYTFWPHLFAKVYWFIASPNLVQVSKILVAVFFAPLCIQVPCSLHTLPIWWHCTRTLKGPGGVQFCYVYLLVPRFSLWQFKAKLSPVKIYHSQGRLTPKMQFVWLVLLLHSVFGQDEVNHAVSGCRGDPENSSVNYGVILVLCEACLLVLANPKLEVKWSLFWDY